MRLSCIPSKNLATEPLPVAPAEPVTPAEPSVKKCSSCNCAPVRCAPVACAPVRCVPLSCWKASQPLVLRSTPPSETEKLTDAAKVSALCVIPYQVSATGPVARVSQQILLQFPLEK